MTTFGALPVELHRLIAKRCGDIGHGVLTNFSLLNRYFQSLALPLLTSSAVLDGLRNEDNKLQLFTHQFAPLHRTELVTLSLALGRSQIPAHYSLDDGLDEIYANIISLLPLLKTVHLTVCSGPAKDALEEGDFSLTLKAMGRLKHLETLTICQDTDDCSVTSSLFVSHLLFECVPRFQSLKKLKLDRMDLVLPSTPAAQTFPSIQQLALQSVKILKNPSSNPRGDPLAELITFFSPSLESLNIKDIVLEMPPHSFPLLAPRLNRLELSFAPNPSYDPPVPTSMDNNYLEQCYRQILENFSGSSSLQSICIPEPIGLAQLQLLQNRGGLPSVYQVNQQ
ncbi:hypothetical protein VP01_1049g4 [Puccinia sorghi]|uniref:F-box domain-containing protein n=1 Tax=Puccinia sorghi TaxID=27349 RepID=A0A0L6VU74_9BASI|nr:hypothetical protein VP01_1049g4 [Puccinia sorghi]